MERFILLHGEINPELVARFRDELESFLLIDPPLLDPVTVLIASRGGYAQSGNKLIEVMQGLGRPWIARIYRAASAAAMFALSAPKRQIVLNGEFKFHLGSIRINAHIAASKGTPGLELTRAEIEDRKNLLALIARNAPRLPKDKIQQLLCSSWLSLSPAECLQYGVVHEIV